MDILRGNIGWEEHGTFVYEVLVESVRVRTHPALDRPSDTEIHFQKGDLVAVDLCRPSRVPLLGPFLRLSDGCGWLIEKHNDKIYMERVSSCC